MVIARCSVELGRSEFGRRFLRACQVRWRFVLTLPSPCDRRTEPPSRDRSLVISV